MSAGVQAACQTVSREYLLYSVTGNFLAPVSTRFKLNCCVRQLRDTKSFATRQVEITQKQSDDSTRLCMILLADFHKEGETSLLTYSVSPDRKYSPPEACLSPRQLGEQMVQNGVLTQDKLSRYDTLFGLMARFFETRQTPEGVSARNLNGMAKDQTSDQHHLPLTSKTTADWFRSSSPLHRQSDQYAGLAFMLDAYLSFLPLTHSGMFLEDAAACASLDFAMRIFSSDWNLNDWNLRELKTIAGDDGRTYSEARVWDKSGKLVANMTQQSILRPKKSRASL